MQKASKNQYVCVECGKTFVEEVDPNSFVAIFFQDAKSDSPTCPECQEKIVTTTIQKVEITKKEVKRMTLDCEGFDSVLNRLGREFTENEIFEDTHEYVFKTIDGLTRYGYEQCRQYACDGWASNIVIFEEQLTKQEVASINW